MHRDLNAQFTEYLHNLFLPICQQYILGHNSKDSKVREKAFIDFHLVCRRALHHQRGGKHRMDRQIQLQILSAINAMKNNPSELDTFIDLDAYRKEQRKSRPPIDEIGSIVRAIIPKAKVGRLSAALKIAFSNGLTDPSHPGVMNTLRALHPPPAKPFPSLPPAAPDVIVDMDTLLRICNTRLPNKSAPGPSGITGEIIANWLSTKKYYKQFNT
jgi:hypothetical protein